MALPKSDVEHLEERGFAYETASEGNMTCLILSDYELPMGYNPSQADLLLRFSPGYPDVAPDMWWFQPAVRLAAGPAIPATDQTEQYLGRAWQRWSRHLAAGQWQSGIDGLESFLALVRRDLERWAPVTQP